MSSDWQYTVSSSVPKLMHNGANWLLFEFRFRIDVDAMGYWGHFDGTAKRPVAQIDVAPEATSVADTADVHRLYDAAREPVERNALETVRAAAVANPHMTHTLQTKVHDYDDFIRGSKSTSLFLPDLNASDCIGVDADADTDADLDSFELLYPNNILEEETGTKVNDKINVDGMIKVNVDADLLEAQKAWDRNDAVAKSLLAQRIPDSTLVRVVQLATAAEWWAIVKSEYEVKWKREQARIKAMFLMQTPAAKVYSVQSKLESLKEQREILKGYAIHISDVEFCEMISRAFPEKEPKAILGSIIIADRRRRASNAK